MTHELLRHFGASSPGERAALAFAEQIVVYLPPSAERTVAVRKLMEACDCLRRASADLPEADFRWY